MVMQILSALQALNPSGTGIARAALGLIKPTGEPQRGYMWEVTITPPLSASSGPLPQNYLESIRYYALSVALPETSIEIIEDHFMGDKYMHAGMVSSNKSINISFWDDQGLTVYAYLQNWVNVMKSEYSRLGRQVSKSSYCRDIKIQLKDTTDLFVNLEIVLHQAFISNLNDVQLAYDTTDVLRVGANFVFDYKDVGVYQKESTQPTTNSDLNSGSPTIQGIGGFA